MDIKVYDIYIYTLKTGKSNENVSFLHAPLISETAAFLLQFLLNLPFFPSVQITIEDKFEYQELVARYRQANA